MKLLIATPDEWNQSSVLNQHFSLNDTEWNGLDQKIPEHWQQRGVYCFTKFLFMVTYLFMHAYMYTGL